MASGTAVENSSYRLPSGNGAHWHGQHLRQSLLASAAFVEQHAAALNALNVYPVPDGDTGTNMYLTLQAAVKPIAASPSHSAAEVMQSVSRGALMGSRGNSGVILSQVLRGMAESLTGKEQISATDFAAAMQAATTRAYKAVQRPVEGTILTVVREMSEAAQKAAAEEDSFSHVLHSACNEGRASVARTPQLLEKLRQAGVVDAGGQGIYLFFDGIRRFMLGEEMALQPDIQPDTLNAVTASADAPAVNVEVGEYGYCTNFMVFGIIPFDEARDTLIEMGDSAVVVGDETMLKVHIHTFRPGLVLDYATSLGSMSQIKVDNMQTQNENFVESHQSGAGLEAFAPLGSGSTHKAQPQQPQVPTVGPGIVVVVSGAGLEEVFRSMGAGAIISGGQTMNPSTADLLEAVERLPNDQVIILPNNGNIIMAANQVPELSKKRVVVVPTRTIPQGMSALLAINYDAPLTDNAAAMLSAAQAVVTGEVTTAVRDTMVDDLAVHEGDTIGLLDDRIVAAGKDREQVIRDLIGKMNLEQRDLLTLYYGAAMDMGRVEQLRVGIIEVYPDLEIEVVAGGQPFYDYIISAE